MIEAFNGADLSKAWDFKLEDFIGTEQDNTGTNNIFNQSSLPVMPMPNNQVIQSAALQGSGTMQSGLTDIETALLSDEEKNDYTKKQRNGPNA